MTPTSKRKAVLFDLDDTIFDHRHCRREALTALAQAYPVIAGHELRTMEASHERHLQTTHALLLDGGISLSEARHERMRRLFSDLGAVVSDSQLPGIENVYRNTYERSRRPVPGVISIITALKKTLQIGIVTNGRVIEQQEKIRVCGLDGMIDVTVISEKAGVKKPSREIFHLALTELKVSAGDAVFLGDSWKNDVLGARSAGIPAVWFNRYDEVCPEPGSVEEVTNLEPVDRLLRILGG